MTAGRWFAIALLAVFCATGCGGGDGGGGASTTEWADDVCSSITTWTDSIASAADSLRGENLTEDELRSAIEDAGTATEDFADDVKRLGAPDTDAGERAKESLDQLADDVEANVSKIEQALDDVSDGSGLLAAMTVVTGTLSTMGGQMSSTFAALGQLDPGGELEQAFREADACDELAAGSS